MVTVEPINHTCFRDSFRAAAEEITNGLSNSRSDATNGHYTKWDEFFWDVSPKPLLVSYREPDLILNAFARQYRTGALSPIVHQV